MNFTRSTSRALTSLAVIATLVVALVALPVRTAAAAARLVVTRKQPTTSAMLLIASNAERSSVLVENIGTITVFVSNLSTVTTSTGASLAPNQTYKLVGVQDQLYGITASGTADLRVTETIGGTASTDISRLNTSGISNDAANTTVPMSDGSNLVAGNVLIFLLTTAVTANSTTTSTTAGNMAITSHATGVGMIFRSDGTKWQLLSNYAQFAAYSVEITIATTSTSDLYVSVPVTGTITGIDFSSLAALSTDNTNFITFSSINLGQSGAGSTALLAATDANTTKTTGGTALTALARRTLTLTGTAADLAVVKGDVLRVRATADGTLAGAVTRARVVVYVTRTV